MSLDEVYGWPRFRARQLVLETLEERARKFGPVGNAALAELRQRSPWRARYAEDHRAFQMRFRYDFAVRTPQSFLELSDLA